jgi:hypothetical protein
MERDRMKKVIRVYDDMGGRGEKYASVLRKMQAVRKYFEDVESIQHEDFTHELQELNERQRRTRLGKKWEDKTILLDQTSVFVIDYDLLKVSKDAYLTGDNVAYLARCFSNCGIILGLNIDLRTAGENPFDLTLRGHPESYCDVNIGSKQLGNAGLWGRKKEGFRPWCWPQLPDYLKSFEDKLTEIANHLDNPIGDFLGIKNLIKYSPKSVREFIGGDPTGITFRKFVEKSGNGLRGRDKSASDDIVGRIASARLSTWLEHLVLPGQDLLVDAPHLVSRYPSLLEGDHSDIGIWNRTTSFDTFDKIGLNHETIEEHRFKKVRWLSRPAWFWPDLSRSAKIIEIREPWEAETTKYVFCEDSSNFHEQRHCKKFNMESESPFNRRFVRYLTDEGVNYQPRVRLL